MFPKDMLIIGAGPKAVAVAVKAHVLRSSGYRAPEITIVESLAVGNNWRRTGGWTDGRQSLGTSPFKDIGFPYEADRIIAERPVDAAMFEFSWGSYLGKTGQYAKWVDRGSPSPTHNEWAMYLEWALALTETEVIFGDVISIGRSFFGQFEIEVAHQGTVSSDSVMITGSGRGDELLASSCMSVPEFWAIRSKDESFTDRSVIIVGSGETAASITRCIVERSRPSDLIIVSPTETIYSRGESYLENSFFTDPSEWYKIGEAQRRHFIKRTDRAVFSQDVQSLISSQGVHRHIQGRVVGVESSPAGLVAEIRNAESGSSSTYIDTDFVIDARGGNPLWFEELLTGSLRSELENCLGAPLTPQAIESSIGYDLAVEGFPSKIFLPNLAAFRQGPGFPNLSSLGRLSDRVLSGLDAFSPQPELVELGVST